MAGRKTSVIQVMITGDSRDLQQATHKGASAFGILGGAALAAAKVVTSAAGAIAGFSIREFAKFDEAMVNSTAIMGDLSEQMETRLSDAAREVAKTTTFSAQQAAESFYFLASAGLDAEESLAALPKVAEFAQAGNFDMARATDLLTDAQSALGLKSEDTAESMENMVRVSDVLVRATTLANASTEQFSEALTNKAGAALNVLGKDIEEGAAVLAFFADQGLKGASAGEALNIVLRDVTRAAGRNQDEFNKLGLQVLDSEGNLRNMADVTEEFTRVLGPMSDAQRAVTMDQLGLTRSVGNNIRLLLGGADAIRGYEEALYGASGATEEVAEKQLQSFNAQLGLLTSGLADIGITIGEALSAPLGRFVAWFREQLPAIEAFVQGAIPQVEAFVNRSVAKFDEFKQYFNENLREPLNEFKTTLLGIRDVGRAEFDDLLERFRSFAPDFRAALDDGDAEEAGRLLGQFIANTFRSAFETAGDITKPLADWAKSQDWAQIGLTIGSFAIDFIVGFVRGLFSDPAAARDAIDQGTKSITQMFREDFVGGIFATLLLTRVPIIGPIVKALIRPFTLIFRRVGSFTLRTILPSLGMMILRGIGSVFAMIGRGLLAGAGAILSGLATAFKVAIANIGALLRPTWQLLLITVRGAFRRWAFQFAGVAGATIRTAIVALLKVGVKALAKVVAGFVAAIFGWPALIIAAVVAALTVFIVRFRNWFNEQDREFEHIGEALVEFVFQGIRKFDTWFKDNVVKWFNDRFMEFARWFAGKVDTFRAWGKSIVDGMVEGIKKSADDLKNQLVNAARNAWEATKRFLGISSPSKLFEGIGQNMMEGMARGVTESAGIIQASVGVNSAMAANEARRFAEMAAQQRAMRERQATPAPTNVNVTVTSADPEQVVEALRRYTRRNGPLGGYVRLGAGEFV